MVGCYSDDSLSPGSRVLSSFVVLWLLGYWHGFSQVLSIRVCLLSEVGVLSRHIKQLGCPVGKEQLEKIAKLQPSRHIAGVADAILDISALLAAARVDGPFS